LPLVEKEKLKLVVWLLVRVTVFEAEVLPTVSLPKLSELLLSVSGRLPVPLRATVCGESGALSLIASVPVRDPLTEGEKVTSTVHLAPAARLDPHLLLETEKLPVARIELMVTDDALVLVSVIALELLVDPTTVSLKDSDSVEGLMSGALATLIGNSA